MGKKQADAPDYEAAALAEGQASRENLEAQTWANRPSQINPWGNVSWTNAPQFDDATNQYINRWTQETELDPRLQSALGSQMDLMAGRSELGAGMMGDIAGDFGNRMDFGQYGSQTNVSAPNMVGNTQYNPEQLQRGIDYSGAANIDNPEFTRQSAEDSLYNRQAGRLNQQFEGEDNALRIKMRNQGLQPGDQSWDSQMQQMNQRKTDAYEGAQAQAMQLGGQEAQRMFDMQSGLRGQQTGEQDRMGQFANQAGLSQFGMDTQAEQQGFRDRLASTDYNQGQNYKYADYQNTLRQQAMNEGLMGRNQRLNEVNALISGQQVGNPQFQPFQGAGVAQTPQLLQAAGMQGQQAAANQSADNMMAGNLLGGATQLATTGMMLSDRRLKRNIKHIGTQNGHSIYSYDYVWGVPGIGVMADEIPQEHVVQMGDYSMVDYGSLFGGTE